MNKLCGFSEKYTQSWGRINENNQATSQIYIIYLIKCEVSNAVKPRDCFNA